MIIAIPIAGEGRRFLEAGWNIPKPLIQAKDRPMFEWALKSFDFLDLKKQTLIFICLKEHIDEHNIDKELKKRYPNCIIIPVENVTRGQACTVLLAKEHINKPEPLIIFNTDTFFRSDLQETLQKRDIDGIITVFESRNPRFSYAKTGQNGFVVEVAEKKPISIHATVGMYHFSKGSDFVWAAERMIEKGITTNNEFYVGPAYNELINSGKKIMLDHSTEVWEFGTPESLKRFEEEFKY